MTGLKNMNILVLAYMGDAVYETAVREKLVRNGQAKTDALHRKAVKYVSAAGQAKGILAVKHMLTEEETGIFMRGRNHKPVSRPRNQRPVDYKNATGLEALLGYLYLKGEKERLEEIVNAVISAIDGE